MTYFGGNRPKKMSLEEKKEFYAKYMFIEEPDEKLNFEM